MYTGVYLRYTPVYTAVYTGIHRYTIHQYTQHYTQIYTSIHRYTWVYTGIHQYTQQYTRAYTGIQGNNITFLLHRYRLEFGTTEVNGEEVKTNDILAMLSPEKEKVPLQKVIRR